MPLVSIIIPVYNGSDFVAEAITSALQQTHREIEIIVVNDGSRDEGKTDKAIRQFIPNVRYIDKDNGGVASALNAGVEAAQGEFISWLSHDDAYEKNKLETQLAFLRNQTKGPIDKMVIYSDAWFMDEKSLVHSRSNLPTVPPERFFEALFCGHVVNGLFRMEPFFMNGCTALIPKAAFERAGRFDEQKRTTQDTDMWFRMNSTTDFLLGPGPTLRSRIHKGQGTYILRKERVAEIDELYLKAFDLYSPGTKYDLDLAKTAYALKRDHRMRSAYKKTWHMAWSKRRSSDTKYLLGALLYNRAFSSARLGMKSLKRRVKEKKAARTQ
ncbi:MAG: glycosyltransferase family 2 protein [Methanomassiliicoccales archaeon]|jgi:glycosyltransferase involved in cell wall biosynthesis